MLTWKWVLGAAAALLLMRIGGLISNFWTALGVIGFLVILALLQMLPAFRRFATAIFVGWVAISFAIPMLSAALRMDWPILGAALTRRSLDSELRAAEWQDPVAYRARVGLARYCQEVDRIQGDWLTERLRELRQTIVPSQPSFFRRIGTAFGFVAAPAPPAILPVPSRDLERKHLEAFKLIEQHRLECRSHVLRTTMQATEPLEQDWREGIVSWFADNPRLTLWSLVMLLIAGAVVAILVRQLTVWSGVKSIAAIVIAALLVHWFLWGAGQARAKEWIGEPRTKREAVTVSPLQYVNQNRVPGSFAPRAKPPTAVVEKSPGVWEVSIDGTNEYGYRDPIGHRTGITVKPSQRVMIRHLGGVPAVNDHGDRFSLCGIKRRIHPREKFRFPEQLYGLWIGSIAGDKFRYTRWPCGEAENSFTNETNLEMELILFFNTNEVYALQGVTHDYGFAYAGWDGERARFEVRLQ